MKRLITLVLLVAMVGSALAMAPVYQPPVPWVVTVLRLFAPSWKLPAVASPGYEQAPSGRTVLPPGYAMFPLGSIPVPPICNLACRLRPVQAIAQ